MTAVAVSGRRFAQQSGDQRSLLDLRGNIPLSFTSRMARPRSQSTDAVFEGFLRGSSSDRSPIHAASVGRVFRLAQRDERAQGVLDEVDRNTGIICDQRIALDVSHLAGYPRKPLQRPKRRRWPDQQHTRDLPRQTGSRVVLQVDQATSSYQTFHRQQQMR